MALALAGYLLFAMAVGPDAERAALVSAAQAPCVASTALRLARRLVPVAFFWLALKQAGTTGHHG